MGYSGSLSVDGVRSKSHVKWNDFLELTKPRINLLVLVTTLTAMWVAEKGTPALDTVLLTMLGTALAASSAGAFNQYFERDIDAIMLRTMTRPIPAGRISPGQALSFAFLLGGAAFLVLSIWVNVLTAYIALSGIAFYAVVYTLWLKRSTPQNIVIGGAAGAVGPLIGWAAVTGEISIASLLMFAVVFFWTPPHFWALALYVKDDYEKAGVPMLPVVVGERGTHWQIAAYSAVLFAASLGLFAVGALGYIYLAASLLLGFYLARYVIRLLRDGNELAARAMFGYSIVYLFALFASMVVDVQLM